MRKPAFVYVDDPEQCLKSCNVEDSFSLSL